MFHEVADHLAAGKRRCRAEHNSDGSFRLVIFDAAGALVIADDIPLRKAALYLAHLVNQDISAAEKRQAQATKAVAS